MLIVLCDDVDGGDGVADGGHPKCTSPLPSLRRLINTSLYAKMHSLLCSILVYVLCTPILKLWMIVVSRFSAVCCEYRNKQCNWLETIYWARSTLRVGLRERALVRLRASRSHEFRTESRWRRWRIWKRVTMCSVRVRYVRWRVIMMLRYRKLYYSGRWTWLKGIKVRGKKRMQWK